ncbi:MAG TPA: lipopolysaccharide assembly protein LapA domain-containing protein [Mycobacteriales bacterium]|nr:lipopolysaccharide assembly protein LapA domain-containing protein [Mycobacteriales bacterium]
MARRREHEPMQIERTRTSSTLVAVTIALIFLVLLVIFIAQNDRKVPLHFLGGSGSVSEALALIAAAVAGGVLVLAVGVARVLQLRVGARRHNRAVAKRQGAGNAAAAATPASTLAEAESASPPPQGES